MTLGEARQQGPLSCPKESISKKSAHHTFNQNLTSKGTLADASLAPHHSPQVRLVAMECLILTLRAGPGRGCVQLETERMTGLMTDLMTGWMIDWMMDWMMDLMTGRINTEICRWI
jgi:hypothetical protein